MNRGFKKYYNEGYNNAKDSALLQLTSVEGTYRPIFSIASKSFHLQPNPYTVSVGKAITLLSKTLGLLFKIEFKFRL